MTGTAWDSEYVDDAPMRWAYARASAVRATWNAPEPQPDVTEVLRGALALVETLR